MGKVWIITDRETGALVLTDAGAPLAYINEGSALMAAIRHETVKPEGWTATVAEAGNGRLLVGDVIVCPINVADESGEGAF